MLYLSYFDKLNLEEIKDKKVPMYFNIKNPNNQTTIDRIRDEVYTLQYGLKNFSGDYLEPYVESWLKDYPWKQGPRLCAN